MVSKSQARKNIARLQAGLVFRGEVPAVRQTYYVFEAKDAYLLLSFALSEAKAGSGYFNMVDAKAVEYVRERFAGERAVTAKEVAARAKRTAHAPSNLIALNILYVLVGLGEARIVRAGPNRELVFSIRKGR